MMIVYYWKRIALFILTLLFSFSVRAQFHSTALKQDNVVQFERSDFEIILNTVFTNPYDAREVTLDLVAKTPTGKQVVLPCYFLSNEKGTSHWRASFAPTEVGTYRYHFALKQNGKKIVKTNIQSFSSAKGNGDGFLHTHDYWTLKFDSGKPFRGIGENIGWESRSFENDKWTYDYLLPTLSDNGANFFRTWMCVWNLPIAWKTVHHTSRYTHSDNYFNEGGIERMDALVKLCDSLNLFFMVSIDAHGALIETGEWKYNNHNSVNGGPAKTPTAFFTNAESRAMYKNRLRYIVARWGYSPSIGAWEFFNEIDNASRSQQDAVLIPDSIITAWHREMAAYLKTIDPYDHIITTSISHREIKGMNAIADIDLNQKHIYNRTNDLPGEIRENALRFKKPYVIGEFGYDWDWDKVSHDRGEGFDYDYKRGLWYGLFSPTPIVPMTWWWEFFDDRKMTPYMKNVSIINEAMLNSGAGSFEECKVIASGVESFAVKCGEKYFVYILNNTNANATPSIQLAIAKDGLYTVQRFDPTTQSFDERTPIQSGDGTLKWNDESWASHKELILIFTADSMKKSSLR